MNRKIGVTSSWINMLAVLGFAVCMLTGLLQGSYLTSMLIAFSFVPMMASFSHYAPAQAKVAGNAAMMFGAMYALCNLLVYFTQTTAVRLQPLGAEALSLLDYSRFGLMFSWDLLGYCLMAIATFFAGLTVAVRSPADRWLRWLLLLHGVFAPACFIMPMLGLFTQNMAGGEWIGTALLLFWCAYFIPVGALSARYFRHAPEA
ncbi:MAG TPA: hypothetical protein PLP25_03880 [Candidatus Limiplasma sp.]|nr:hypothetical protein [Candidatus Limiplasma sp.]HPS80987.1 hypothetical protein [Candidatus Limiplasma sp.]